MKAFDWHPQTLAEFIGQSKLRQELRIELRASISQRRPLNNMVFYGPGGLGKTALARILARERGSECIEVMGKTLTHMEITEALLSNDSDGYDNCGRLVNPAVATYPVIIVDESQKVDREILNLLHPVLEPPDDQGIITFDGMHPITGEIRRIWLRRSSFIFLTNYMGELQNRSPATFSRFPIQRGFQWYSNEEIAELLTVFARHVEISASPEAIEAIARRSNGVPRAGITLLKRAVDYATDAESPTITSQITETMFDILSISPDGLDSKMLAYLKALSQANGRIGLQGLVSILGEDETTISSYLEPILMRRGLVTRNSGGRSITAAGRAVLTSTGEESDPFFSQAL